MDKQHTDELRRAIADVRRAVADGLVPSADVIDRLVAAGESLYAACSVAGCKRVLKARGLCGTHYKRWWRYGDPHIVKRTYATGTVDERVWAHIEKSDGHWLWQGHITREGVPRAHGTRSDGRLRHVNVRRHLFGGLSPGDKLHRTCGERACVNPAHMECRSQVAK